MVTLSRKFNLILQRVLKAMGKGVLISSPIAKEVIIKEKIEIKFKLPTVKSLNYSKNSLINPYKHL